MNTKNVPSLELCQEFDRLCKEKGIVVPETEFIWVKEFPIFLSQDSIVTPDEYKMKLEASPLSEEAKSSIKTFPAPLVSEQGEWLPNERRDKLAFFSGLAINGWFCEVKNYRVMPYERFHVILQEDTEANARMKCLNFLIAERIITKL